MFNKSKKDPLVDAVKSVMDYNSRERAVIEMINEKYHVTSRNGLPHNRRAAYDADIKAALTQASLTEEEIPASDPKDATATIKKVNSSTAAEREAGGRNDNGSGDGVKDSGDPKRANKDNRANDHVTAERDAAGRKEQIKEDEKEQRYANVVEALNKQFRFKIKTVSEDDSSFKSSDGTDKNAKLEESKKSDEPRSDYSAGSDDDESDSARYRAEKRLKRREREGREDLDEEQLDELSKEKLAQYIHRANADRHNQAWKGGRAERDGDWKEVSNRVKKSFKREFGIKKALDKIVKEGEQLDELSKEKLARYMDKAWADRRTSMKKADMADRNAAGAFYAGDKEGYKKLSKVTKEYDKRYNKRDKGLEMAKKKMDEDEQLDELSRGTLSSYMSKARNNEREARKEYGRKFKKGKDGKYPSPEEALGTKKMNYLRKHAVGQRTAEKKYYKKLEMGEVNEGCKTYKSTDHMKKAIKRAMDKKKLDEAPVVLPQVHRPTTVVNKAKKQDKGTVTGGTTTINKNSNTPVRPGPQRTV